MKFRFRKKRIENLYYEGKRIKKFESVEDAFFDALTIISNAKDTRDLYGMKSLHMEKLKGKLKGKHSIRLNDQFRLIFKIKKEDDGRILDDLDIEDYH